MAATTNIQVGRNDGWQKVASNPEALTITCNTPTDWEEWFVAVTAADAAPGAAVAGELLMGNVSWMSGPVDGYVWVRSNYPRGFAITKEEA